MCGGEGSEILKGRVSHGQTCASRVQLLYPKGLNGFFDWGISKISYITSCIWALCYYSWNTMFMSGIHSTDGLIRWR